MASTRKAFLAAASAAGAGFALGEPAQAKPAKPASALAHDFAERMKRFDPHLSDAQVKSIALQIDQLEGLGTQLRPKGRGLSNGDAPSPQFRVDE